MTEPDWADAWLLVALVYGNGEPSATLGAADALNHAAPTLAEWSHACIVLGERDLIGTLGRFPHPTLLGIAAVERIHSRKGIGLFRTTEFVLDEIRRASPAGSPLDPPDERMLAEAYRAYKARTGF